MDESPEVEGGGSTAAMGSTNSLAMGSPKEGGWDAAPVEDSTRGCLELIFIGQSVARATGGTSKIQSKQYQPKVKIR